MAAPSVSNLTQINASNANTWTLSAVATASAAVPYGAGTTTNGIDGTTAAQALESSTTSVSAGTRYSAYTTFTSVNISGAQQAIALHVTGDSTSFSTLSSASNAVQVVLFSGGGTTNYAYWDLGGFGDPIHSGSFGWKLLVLSGDSPTGTGGTWDNTDVTGIGFTYLMSSSGAFNFRHYVDQILHINGEVSLDGGDGTTNATMSEYWDLLKATSGTTYHSLLVEKAGRGFNFGFPVRFNSALFNDSVFGFGFRLLDGLDRDFSPNDYYTLTIQPPASGSITMQDVLFSAENNTYDATITSTDTVTLSNIVFANTDAFSCTGSGVTTTGVTVSSPNSCTISGYSGTLTVNDSVAAITMSGDLTAGATLQTNSDLLIDFAGTDLSDLNIDFTASNTVTVSPTAAAQTYNLASVTSTGTVNFDNDTVHNTTVQVATALTYTVASPTTGGGVITDTSPPVTITVSNANLVDNTKYLLRNETQDTELAIGVVTGGAGYTSSTLTRGTDYNNGDTITLYGTYQSGTDAKKNYSESAVGGAVNIQFVGTQDAWTEYTDIGINGSLVDQGNGGECTIDGGNVQIDVNDADNKTTKQRLMAWLVYAQTTDYGIRNWFNALNLVDASNGIWDQTVADINVSNEKAGTTLEVKDPARLVKANGSSFITGSTYNIEWEVSGLVSQISTGSGLSAAQAASLSNIESKTAGLTYTVANHVDANIHYVNDEGPITGTGTAGDPWGP